MSVPLHLYAHLRIHQVFGANTDVGKTLFTTALCLAETQLGRVPHKEKHVHYLKPVSTGPASASDTAHLTAHVPALTRTATLIQYPDALSPHLAARIAHADEPHKIPSDTDLRAQVSAWIADTAAATPVGDADHVLYVETAGGVHSPAPSGTSQATVLRPFRFPTVLIGSPHLGGISATISAYESLILQGYDVDAILVLAEQQGAEKWGNAEYLAKWTQEHAHRGLRFWAVGGPALAQGSSSAVWGPPPERGSRSDQEDREAMRQWYRGLVHGEPSAEPSSIAANQGLSGVLEHLQQRHKDRLKNLDSLAQRTRDVCWWPFTQHEQFKSNADVTVIDSAYGDMFVSYQNLSQKGAPSASSQTSPPSLIAPLLDSSASWWTQCLGHANPQLALAAARAAARYGHVLFPGAANEPATKLSETLTMNSTSGEDAVQSVAPWASRVFFSDDGSTGTEVAFKMAIASAEARYSTSAGQPSASTPRAGGHSTNPKEKEKDTAAPSAGASKTAASNFHPAETSTARAPLTPAVLGLRGSYHGDTIGAMDASEPSVYNARVPWYTGKGAWIGAPVIRFKNGVPTVEADLEAGAEDEWDFVRAELGSEGAGAEATQSVAWSRSYDSLAAAYDVRARLESDPLASIYRRHLIQLLRRIANEHAVLGGGGYRFSALVLEPVILGAGGMRFVDPLFQRVLVDVVRDEGEEIFGAWDDLPALGKSGSGRRTPSSTASHKEGDWRGLPVVFDEVFTGLYRLGHLSPSRSLLGVDPDILVLAKILTGGLVPMSVTLASSSIFDTFTFPGSTKVDALLHGHSYTAHAVGCEVAQETLHVLSKMEREGKWADAQREWGSTASSLPAAAAPADAVGSPIWSFWSSDAVNELSKLERVRSTMALGTVLVVELLDENGGYASSAATDILRALRTRTASDIISGGASPSSTSAGTGAESAEGQFSIHARPLGNVLYFMCSLNSPAATLRSTEKALLALLA
ncbi:hypothetical protein OC834_000442 [Tilletia horrida]|uniref:Dethiobiotin synthase n=1 Tax=Tilletia horrida TaxID=155126 RepID=A0AAN6GJ69_9BASI|nr:hypothetical protein OC842_001824 [Tilletia horrida]KAK0538374.1 hypothetical protein OC834_000442 [Tilletia horrida]